MNHNAEVDHYIKQAAEARQETLRALRALISEVVPQCEELFKWKQPVYATSRNFCYLRAAKNHVNLGFFGFDHINDPNGLLEGEGSQMRHIKIKDLNDFDSNELKRIIIEAENK